MREKSVPGEHRRAAGIAVLAAVCLLVMLASGPAAAAIPAAPLPGTPGERLPAMALPHVDTFDAYPVGVLDPEPADLRGPFEAVDCAGGRAGRCVRDAGAARRGLPDTAPYALLGDGAWANFTVAGDVLFERAGRAELAARAGSGVEADPPVVDGYFLVVDSDGGWSIERGSGRERLVLTKGERGELDLDSWHRISLRVQESTLTAVIDGAIVGRATDSLFTDGEVGLGSGGNTGVQFDDLAVTTDARIPASENGPVYAISHVLSGKFLQMPGGSTTTGTPADLWPDTQASWVQWQAVGLEGGYVKLVNRYSGLVLGNLGPAASPGDRVGQWYDTGDVGQQWQLLPATKGMHTIRNRQNGLYLTATTTANNAPVSQDDFAGTASEWTLLPR